MGQVVLELYSPYPQWNLEEGRHTAQESGNKTRNAPIGMFLDSSDFFFFFKSDMSIPTLWKGFMQCIPVYPGGFLWKVKWKESVCELQMTRAERKFWASMSLAK